MRIFGFVAAFFSILPSAFGWNATGHRLIAAIAYDRLTPKTRARVDELIRKHPDYQTILLRRAPEDPAARAREAFMEAAAWADVIKGDPRFWDESHQDAHPTALLPGFPDMKRHTMWHYYDTPLAPDGAFPGHQDPPHALSELPRLLREIGKEPDDKAAYDLLWIEHITGDLHQPLHCVSRFLLSQPQGDAGGNGVILDERRNLHSLWDNSAGIDIGDEYVRRYVAEAVAAHPRTGKVNTNVRQWIKEGYLLAKSQVYTFGNETGSRDHPLHLPGSYEENARRVAQGQIALAGYRLAAVLNDRLK
jgi:hypothetical protein